MLCPQLLYQFASPHAVRKGSPLSTFLPALSFLPCSFSYYMIFTFCFDVQLKLAQFMEKGN